MLAAGGVGGWYLSPSAREMRVWEAGVNQFPGSKQWSKRWLATGERERKGKNRRSEGRVGKRGGRGGNRWLGT